MSRRRAVEWPTLALLVACYALWALATTWAAAWSLPAAVVLLTLCLAQFSSLQHEVLHGHPFRNERLNEALVFPALPLFVPFRRFRDTHLAHHHDAVLTDPYDDPESNYMDPTVWHALPGWAQAVLRFNNTLLGRILIGPAISQLVFMKGDLRAIRAGDARVLNGWLMHLPGVALVLLWLMTLGQMPLWAYLTAAYAAHGLLKIRTFLEHRAHERASGRTVVIEDRGPLALLFLNNNYHVVHHMHPAVPWYRLPALYAGHADRYLTRNDNYHYTGYGQIFRRHLLRAKDPVPHPLMGSDQAPEQRL